MTVHDSVYLIHMYWATKICQRHCQNLLYRIITAHSSVSWPVIISGGTENLSHPGVKSRKISLI